MENVVFGDYVPDFCRSVPQLEKDLRVLFRNEKECEHYQLVDVQYESKALDLLVAPILTYGQGFAEH